MPFHSPRYIKRKRKRMFATILLGVVCCATVFSFVTLSLRSSLFEINTISVHGLDSALNNEIQEKIRPLVSNIFIIPKSEIERIIKENFKNVETLEISRAGLREIAISLQGRTTAAVVCPGFREEGEKNECYASDSSGFIFSLISTSTPQNHLNHYYVPETGSTTPGSNFISTECFRELEKFMNQSRLGGLAPLGILIGENGDYEMYVKNRKGDSEVTIYFDDNAPFDETLSNLLTFWQDPGNAKNKKATTTRSFDYINLRFGNAVYYSTQ